MEIGLMLMGMKDDFKRILVMLASDFDGPAGAIPVERLVRKHLRRFEELRSHGLTWEQISRLLFGAGILRSDGRAFPPSHLRGVFGRQRKRVLKEQSTEKAMRSGVSAGPRPTRAAGPRRASSAQMTDAGLACATRTGHSAAVHPRSGEGGSVSRRPNRHDGKVTAADLIPADTAADRNRAKVLALLRQSALARRAVN